MFDKKSCKKCGKKMGKGSMFCSNCGIRLDKMDNDWGMLGEHDETNEFEQFSRNMLGGVGGNMLGKMFEGAMRMLEKEMQKEMKSIKTNPKTDIRLFINGKRINLNNSDVQEQKSKKQRRKPIELPSRILKNFSKLPKEEPKTNMRRLSDRVVYEIKIPGVKSQENISITALENSIEIKASAKDKAYFKLIPINLPIINYDFSDENLILEFEA